MDPALAPVFARLRDRMSESAFLARIDALDREFGGLLDPEALGLLLLDEEGLNEGARATVRDLRGREEASLTATVREVSAPRSFTRADGSEGRVASLVVADETGTCRLTLWDRAADLVSDGLVKPGDRVRIANARVKDTPSGLELHTSTWTRVEVEGADPARLKLLRDVQPDAPSPPAPAGLAAGLPEEAPLPERRFQSLGRLVPGTWGNDLRVRVVRAGPLRSFSRRDGTTGKVVNLDVEDESGRGTLVAWDEAADALAGVSPGAVLTLEEVAAKEREGRVEAHTTRRTRIRSGAS